MKLILSLLLAAAAWAQFVPPGAPVPRTGKPPVVFLNGYQSDCPSSFGSTFGNAGETLARSGRASLFFDNCTAGRLPIEDLANRFGEFLRAARYADGQPLDQVDVVAHSMGGLILRSYLAGKQTAGSYTPPFDHRIRKAVFIATPHFGTSLTQGLAPDIQVTQLVTGSQFLFDLATWNQGTDDLRGVEAISILGNGGTDSLNRRAAFDDGVVSLTSGSLGWVRENATRIVPHCHTTSPLITLLGLCQAGAAPIARIDTDAHVTARALVSFFEGTTEWSSLGSDPRENVYLSRNGALHVGWRDGANRPISIESAAAMNLNLAVRDRQVAYIELIAAQAFPLTLRSTSQTVQEPVDIKAGYSQARIVKTGPLVARVYPSAAAVFPLVLAPGMLVSAYGTNLSASSVRINDTAIPVNFNNDTQVNALLPDLAIGAARFNLQNSAGEHTINVVTEPSMPTIFLLGGARAAATNAATGAVVGPDAPLTAGDFVAIYATGLGLTTRRGELDWAVIQPEVFVGGRTCEIAYAGRAPGFPGLDQVNCRLAPGLPANTATTVELRSRGRVSNTATLNVR